MYMYLNLYLKVECLSMHPLLCSRKFLLLRLHHRHHHRHHHYHHHHHHHHHHHDYYNGLGHFFMLHISHRAQAVIAHAVGLI